MGTVSLSRETETIETTSNVVDSGDARYITLP